MILTLAVFSFSLTGVNTGNIPFMNSSMGTMAEYFTMASYASTIGMGAVMPLLLRFKARFKVRNKLTLIFVGIAILSCISGTTDQPEIIIATAFIIGALKIFILIELLGPLMVMLSPDGHRGKFYSILYPIALGSGQLVNYLATDISHLYNWEFFYILISAAALIMAMLCWIFLHNQYFSFKLPLYYIDWVSVLLFSSAFMFSSYVLSFGKQQDWLNSERIIYAIIFALASFLLLLHRQTILKRPYMSFKIFKKKNVYSGLVMFLLTGMFMAVSSMQNTYAITESNE